jgi:hypothetical protein
MERQVGCKVDLDVMENAKILLICTNARICSILFPTLKTEVVWFFETLITVRLHGVISEKSTIQSLKGN